MKQPTEKVLLDIAKRHTSMITLDTRNRDHLDIHYVAVWEMKACLEAAFKAGQYSIKK